ncbi:maleylpyruvate isomerase family mycothiol-dependent enzyme [Streptomyces uncialis]|uniref:maleylpyruvate isomerase family mycothiol-dependent enzyme n=1 Tax=Streptomyces uncialis TaxID=1048205 RepID=UPI00224F7312|nr:maleylpyruvate isomerase family mycothiol-dependent enzyme [Streptomyces uncialis]MCX4663132.1 maleylpyruvate isomerase family mycothiol-dependent enzyme [Streptomyces uncialis]WTE10283.1 maleylpyruvate isomerase family mycothiol-dependent enzyme [Streptomyces uncialis]
MNDHVRDLAAVREATERLLSAANGLDNASLAEPSRLPGWSRGHILAHLARNADALVNVLGGHPMYPSAGARDSDIERDADRDLGTQLKDVRESSTRLAVAAQIPADWSRTVELRNGVTDSASRLPFRRLVEVELHHVDLGIGYELEDLPAGFVQQEINFLAERFRGLESVPAVLIRQDDGRLVRTGHQGGTPLTVTGRQADLVGWLAGRRDGAALTVTGGPLPLLPPL